MQLRQVSSLSPVELWSYGPGRHFEAVIGYSLYHVLQAATCISGISVVITLFLKYDAARVVRLRVWKRNVLIMLMLSPLTISVSMEIILICTQSLPADIRERYRILNKNVEEHSIVGVVDLRTLPSQINMSVMSSSVILFPIVGITSRRKFLSNVNMSADRFSQLKNAQNKTFVKGLTLQTFLPLFFYVPISTSYFCALVFKTEILFQQYFMFLIPAFPTFFDPIITLYFVTPYRNRLKKWFGLEKSSTIVSSLKIHE